ncbi:uncharacterized protein BDV14DRAFT_123581 [Aspergillus stella-maris]|uniref:uncharacterized protein n=1 Tax=Aspergillus stella-maris TaxID=1810926 RepID=UPI003CCD1B7C
MRLRPGVRLFWSAPSIIKRAASVYACTRKQNKRTAKIQDKQHHSIFPPVSNPVNHAQQMKQDNKERKEKHGVSIANTCSKEMQAKVTV